MDNRTADQQREGDVAGSTNVQRGNRTGYRKHPYHKPGWGKYPNITISKGPSVEQVEYTDRRRKNKSNDNMTQSNSSKKVSGEQDDERSLGNESIRRVLAKLFKHDKESLYYRVYTISLPWLIKQIARFSWIWEMILYFVITTTLTLTLFYAFFTFHEEVVWQWISIADYVFAADTIVRLSVEIWRHHTRATVVVFIAPYTMLQFLLDVCSLIPLVHLYFWITGSNKLSDLSNVDYYRLHTFLRGSRILKFFDLLKRERMVNEKFLFIFKFMNFYLGFIYLMACLFVFTTGLRTIDFLLYNNLEQLQATYLKDFQSHKDGYGSTPWDIFVISTAFTTALITTVGYGDVVPNNFFEVCICIFCMLFGAIFLNGMYTGEMTNFRLDQDGARFDLYHRLSQIRVYLTSLNTLPFFNAKVEEYYNCLWTYRQGVLEVPFMQQIPLTFHEELLLDICLEMFNKSLLLYNLDAPFLRAISKVVTVALYNSNMVLCSTGSYSGCMFYILQGECQVMSKINPANVSAIIRAGSIIGETSLLFSFPYTTTVETRTCCQFIILTKQDLVDMMELFPNECEIIRSRCKAKISDLFGPQRAYGIDPVCWVKAKTDLHNPSRPNPDQLKRTMRWGTGWNSEVLDDVVDDSNDIVIINTPCDDPTVEKNHLMPYISCVVPEIFHIKKEWIRFWNYMIMSITFYNAFFGPYCLVFPKSTKLIYYLCHFQFVCRYLISIIFVVDVFVEIFCACPVAGLYYKFWDGLAVALHQPGFYLNVFAAIPLELWTLKGHNIYQIIGTIFKILKLWKVVRFLHYLDNVYPLRLFSLRFLQTVICVIYATHFIACISYFIACPFDPSVGQITCKQMSWLSSYEVNFKSTQDPNDPMPVRIRKNTLGYGAPYLFSFFYACATFSSAGFGDFNPQSRLEMVWSIGFQLFGFLLIGYCTSVLTSALSCKVRSELTLQQKLVSLYQFMNFYHVREQLQNRIVEHFLLQHQLRGGVSLNGETHLMFDAPSYLRNDVLYLEVHELLDGIPVFSKLESDVIIKLSNAMKLFIIPPYTTVVHMGEVRRALYVIKKGSIGVYEPGNEKAISVLEESSHFGIRDLLFGEPSHYIIRSVSYVAIYEIKQRDFELALQFEDDFWDLIKREKQRIKKTIHEITMIYAVMEIKGEYNDKATKIPSWIEVPARIDVKKKNAMGKKIAKKAEKIKLLNDEFDDLYNKTRWTKLCKYFLLRKTIHPVGLFSKFWNCVMSLIACMTVLCLALETFCYIRMPWFRVLQIGLDWANYVDIYLKLHWAYYNPHNQMLITHPIKTAHHYVLHGSIVMDVAICAPFELLLFIFGLTNFFGYGDAASWYSKLRWVRFLQIKRVPIVFEIVHNIFKKRTLILFCLYVLLTLFACTLVSTVAIFIACPWEANDWEIGDEYKIPMCLETGWVKFKMEEVVMNPGIMSDFYRRWVLGLYYVSQAVLVIGFGDMIILDFADVLLLIFMCMFGFIFMCCVNADISAAQVNSNQARATFVEEITVLNLIMRREKVPKKLFTSVMLHLHGTWNRSRGLQARELFTDLAPVLESELYGYLVEEKLLKVPIFKQFPAAVLRNIFRYMKTLYVNRGDRVMRFGNLEYEMYIIASGKMYITDQHLNYISSLGPGESFGETSMLYGLARRYNAFAACKLELYVLSSYNFEKFLGRYPNFKNQMKLFLSSEKQDYFESILEKKMKAANLLSAEKKTKMLATFAERTIRIKDIVANHEDFVQSGLDNIPETKINKRSKLVGRGDLDENLPFLYFTKSKKYVFLPFADIDCEIEEDWKRKDILSCSLEKLIAERDATLSFHLLSLAEYGKVYPVIHPKCRLFELFSTVIAWICFITPALVMYKICFVFAYEEGGYSFSKSSSMLQDISYVLEIIYLIHILLNFCIAFEVKNGIYNKSPRSIILRYLTTFDGFFLELITCIPFIMEKTFNYMSIEFASFSKDTVMWLESLYLLRFIRLYYYFSIILSYKDDLTVSTFRLQLTMSVSSFCLMAHMLACLFYWISPCTRPDLSNTTVKYDTLCPPPKEGLDLSGWTTEYVLSKDIATNKERLDAWRWWFRSLYWVVTTISTTGFGDIVPVTINEMLVAVLCTFCGAFVLSLILSQITSGIASLSGTQREYMYQVNLLVKHLKNIGLSKTRQNQVMMYFRTLWDACRGVPYHKSWKTLPLSMQIEVAYALFGKTLLKVPFFKDYKEKIFIRQLSSRVKHTLFIPGSYIHKDGDPGTSMFVVYKGLVSGTLTMNDNEPDLKSIYNPGDAFGVFAALFRDGLYKKSYRAETMVEVLEVKQKDIVHLAKKFPQFKTLLYNFITSKYHRRGINVCIFDKQRRKARVFGTRTEFTFIQAVAAAGSRQVVKEYSAGVVHAKRKHRKHEAKGKKKVEENVQKEQEENYTGVK